MLLAYLIAEKLLIHSLAKAARATTMSVAEAHAGTLIIRDFRLDPNGKFSEPGWWIEKDGNKVPESSISADLFYILESLLILAEEIVVLWGADNLRFPQAQRIAFLPEERRDRDNPSMS